MNIKEVCKLNDNLVYTKTLTRRQKVFNHAKNIATSLIAICVIGFIIILIL